jgi:hypothetical protein
MCLNCKRTGGAEMVKIEITNKRKEYKKNTGKYRLFIIKNTPFFL